MRVLNNVITRLQLGILILWISFTIAAFGYFIKDKLVTFDATNKLENIDYKEISNYLTPYLLKGIEQSENKQTILHFSSPNCDCQKYSEEHIQDINKLADINDFNVKSIVINEDHIIPSTPSIAVIDKTGSVIYFGPYGQGLACSQTSGYAQTVLNNHLQGYSANIVIKDAKGCYCEV